MARASSLSPFPPSGGVRYGEMRILRVAGEVDAPTFAPILVSCHARLRPAHALRRSEIYYSDGVCRYCDNASAGIIVDYVKSTEIVPTLLGRLLG